VLNCWVTDTNETPIEGCRHDVSVADDLLNGPTRLAFKARDESLSPGMARLSLIFREKRAELPPHRSAAFFFGCLTGNYALSRGRGLNRGVLPFQPMSVFGSVNFILFKLIVSEHLLPSLRGIDTTRTSSSGK
jgi:hypothetical protein